MERDAWPFRDQMPRPFTAPLSRNWPYVGGLIGCVEQPADDDRPVDSAVLESDKHLVTDRGQEEGAALRPGAELHHRRPPRNCTSLEPGKLDLHPAELVRILVVADEPAHETRGAPAGKAVAMRRAVAVPVAGDKAEQRPVVPAADREVRPVAAGVDDVPDPRQDIRAAEVLTDAADADGHPGTQRRASTGRALRFGERAADPFGEGLGRALGFPLAVDRRRDVDERRGSEVARELRRVRAVDLGSDGSRGRGGGDGLLAALIPAADLDVRRLVCAADPAVECLEVRAEPKVARIQAGLGRCSRSMAHASRA